MTADRIHWVTAFLTMTLLATAARAEAVDNPQFVAWSRFAIGSCATLAGGVTSAAMKMTMETTTKLIEKADDHVTVEITATVTLMGQTRSSPPTKQTIPAKSEKQDSKETGTEKIEAAGKTWECKITESASAPGAAAPAPGQAAGSSKTKLWLNKDVPGGVVKWEATTPRGTMTSVLKSFEEK